MDFNDLFDELLLQPLVRLGFKRRGKKAVFLEDDLRQVGLLNTTSGRICGTGQLAIMLVFRHSFLRETVDLEVPKKPPGYAEHWPYRIQPNSLPNIKKIEFHLTENSFTSYPWNVIDRDSSDAVQDFMRAIASGIELHFLLWTERTTPEVVLDQIVSTKIKATWLKEIWQKDYEDYLGRPNQRQIGIELN